ncbi:MAG: arylsulfatase [Acidobacteria bacterium]|nr:arylsulfatase [Acidobacteriota bacterium]
MQLSRRGFLSGLMVSAGLRAQAPRPNIVFVLADDLGWNDLGYQNPDVRSPNIDRLAAKGVRFTQYHSHAVCSPTRASFHTGRTAFRVGVPSPVPRGEALPLSEKLLPQYLAEAGYQTWLVGKWHLGSITDAHWPHKRGYQHHYGFLGGSIDYYTHAMANRPDWFRNGEAVDEAGYSTDLLAAEASNLIRKRDESKPFFLNLSFNAPHTPLQAPESFTANFTQVANANRRAFLAMIEAMDGAIGRVYGTLEELGLAANTLFVFMSDNGAQTAMGGGSDAPLRGAKDGAFEGGLRVPAFALWPDGLEGGWVFDRLFTVMDWLPTLAAAARFELDPAIPLDGVNMWPYVHDGNWVKRESAILGGGANSAVFSGDWKLVQNAGNRFLFRIGDDPNEEKDLAGENADVVERLTAILRDHPIGTPDRM